MEYSLLQQEFSGNAVWDKTLERKKGFVHI